AISEELISIRDLLLTMNRGNGIPEVILAHPEYLSVYAGLMKTGISKDIIHRLFDECGLLMNGSHIPLARLKRTILQNILHRISHADPFEVGQSTQIAAFIGPTGVGKTTTIAKLAAELHIKLKKKIGLVSVDSFRIGAVEQLKAYANIMGVPYLAAHNHSDLMNALEKLSTLDIILIDSAGHSHMDHERMGTLQELFDNNTKVSTHLVLSATSKARDMQKAVDNFSVLQPATYVFTKLDETDQPGSIIDQIFQKDMPVSFLTNGQNVPDDILPATAKNVLQLILQPMGG
ncbi:AAA family ATPase, partial [Desulfobacterales bacterium HSG17]|nr:AAA family ATPase [Desulfobacterales bacterium HSG17]